MTRVPDEWVEAFGKGWASVPAGEPGARRRAGLEAVLGLIHLSPEIKDRDRRIASLLNQRDDLRRMLSECQQALRDLKNREEQGS